MEPVNQLLVYLGGKGGTGKSTVIKALSHLHKHLNISHSIKLSAFTGTAAAGISTSTN